MKIFISCSRYILDGMFFVFFFQSFLLCCCHWLWFSLLPPDTSIYKYYWSQMERLGLRFIEYTRRGRNAAEWRMWPFQEGLGWTPSQILKMHWWHRWSVDCVLCVRYMIRDRNECTNVFPKTWWWWWCMDIKEQQEELPMYQYKDDCTTTTYTVSQWCRCSL